MKFPFSRTLAESADVTLQDFMTLSRGLRWAYDGPPPVSPVSTRSLVEDVAMWLVREGEARIGMGKAECVVGPGQWLLPATPSTFMQSFAPGTKLLSVRFTARWASGAPLLTFDRPIVLASSHHPAIERDAMRLVRSIGRVPVIEATALRSRAMPFDQLLQIDAAFATLLSTLLPILAAHGHALRPPRRRMDDRVESAIALLDANPSLGSREIAQRLDLSISQLDRLFVAALGLTPNALRHRRRLDRARQRLRQTNEPIKTIAYATHFRRVSHFSAWFHKATGMSPRAYRAAGEALA